MAERIRVACPACNKKLAVTRSAAGRCIRCPDCSGGVQIPALAGVGRNSSGRSRSAQSVNSPAPRKQGRRRNKAIDNLQDDWLSDSELSTGSIQPTTSLPPKKRRKKKKSSKPRLVGTGNEPPPMAARAKMSFRDRLMHGGVLAGLLIMTVSVIWFVGGLMSGVMFFAPPPLFLGGAFACVKGLLDD